MWRKLDNLRKQPRDVRNRYAFWYAFLFTMLIAVIWLSTMPARVDFTGQESIAASDTTGGFARVFNNMRASLIGAEENYLPQNEPPPSTNTARTAEEILEEARAVPERTGAPILISTTSANRAGATENGVVQ